MRYEEHCMVTLELLAKLRGEAKRIPIFALMLACAAMIASAAGAQSYRGSIRGTVFDPSGAVVPNATISAKDVATGLTRDAASSADGTYVVSELPAGTYEVTAKVAGFLPFRATAIVEVGRDTGLDIVMRL